MKKLISWDLDGVIANCQIIMIRRMNEILEKFQILRLPYNFDEYANWNFAREEIFKYTKDEKLALTTSKLYDDPEFLNLSEVFPGTIEFFEKISKFGVKNQITTSRPAKNRQVTMNWLKKNNLLKYFEAINIDRLDEDGREYKIGVVKSKNVLVHFDDDQRVVNKIDQAWLIDRPWNKSETNLDNRRLKGWGEILAKIEDVLKNQ